ncbi:MAG TPA: glycosyltransferase [Candidatus Micrarchaeia archaeon]|nr:glycosyltransferase [Candidatus Micrarchaeia archaeon]
MVVPVRNQADHIETVVAGYSRALTGVSHELLLVVNGSRDDSLNACRRAAAAAEAGSISVIESRPGWGSAVLAGLRAGTGDILGYTNSARTAPGDLRLGVDLACSDVAASVLVKATRRYRKSMVRRAGSLLFNLEARLLLGLMTWDVNGTPKLFSRAIYRQLALSEQGDLLDVEVMAACERHGVRIVGFDTDQTSRAGGRSSTSLLSAMKLYVACARLARRADPDRARSRPGGWEGLPRSSGE